MYNYTAGFAAPLVYSNLALPKNNIDGSWQCIISQPQRLVLTPSKSAKLLFGFLRTQFTCFKILCNSKHNFSQNLH
jgi:hypothetical protein